MSVRAGDVDLERDRDLVTRYQAGDEGAFAELYERYFDRLCRYCERRVGDRHVAEELAQEAFARALGALPSFGGDRRFYPWLTVIAQRLCIDHHRRARRFELTAEVDAGTVEGADAPVLERAALDLLDVALTRVTPRHREVLLLRESEGLSYQAIGARMGTPHTAVETLLHRARRALRREATEVAGPGGLVTVPVLGALTGALQRLRARVTVAAADRAVHLPAVAAPLAAVAASLALVIPPGALVHQPPTPSEHVIAAEGVGAPPIASSGAGGHAPAPPPPPPAADAGSVVGNGGGSLAPPPVSAGPVRVFVGAESTEEAAKESEALPIHEEMGPAFVGADPDAPLQELYDHLSSRLGVPHAP